MSKHRHQRIVGNAARLAILAPRRTKKALQKACSRRALRPGDQRRLGRFRAVV